MASWESYTETLNATVPATSGPKYVLIRTSSDGALNEPMTTNNVSISPRILAVDVPLLEIGAPLTETAAVGQWDYYRFEAQRGDTVLFSLDGDDGLFGLYVRQSLPPTVSDYDVAGRTYNQADQEARLPDLLEGTYFLGVLALPGSGSTWYTLSAELATLGIRQVAPSDVSNTGSTTIAILGDNFSSEAQVQLVAPDDTTIEGEEFYQDWTTLYATFDLTGIAPGLYDVVVTNPDLQSVVEDDALTVSDTAQQGFYAMLSMPGVHRPGRTIDLHIEFGNRGTENLQSPLLILRGAAGDYQWRLPGQNGWVTGSEVSLLGLSSDGPVSVLRPGQPQTLTVELKAPFRDENIDVSLWSAGVTPADGSDELIDWDSLKDGLRPAVMTIEAWDALWPNLVANVGGTWGDYVAMLNDNASYLAGLGETVMDADALWWFEVHQAFGYGQLSLQEDVTDSRFVTPGLPLTFWRYFSGSILGHYEVNALGRGWYHNWEKSLEFEPDGTVVYTAERGFVRRFQPNLRGGYISQLGDHATFSAVAGGYELREPNGLSTRFRLDGRLDYLEDANGNRIGAGYTNGRLTSLTHSSGQSLTIAYDADGYIETVTDSEGRSTTFGYDGDHLTSVVDTTGQTTSYVYNASANPATNHALLEVHQPLGSRFFSYDEEGRLSGTTGDGGATPITTSYDSAGKVSMTDALGATTDYFYDHRGLLAAIDDPLSNVTLLSYDDQGQLTGITDALGQASTLTYDQIGNLVQIADPLGGNVTFAYSGPFSRLSSSADANANTTRYGYDDTGNLTSITYSNGTTEKFTIDSFGNLEGSTNRRGQSIAYAYDGAGRVVMKTYPNGTTDQFEYDPNNGNLIAVEDSQGTTTLEYASPNGDHLLTKITYPSGRFLQYEYDSAGRRTQMVDQGGNEVNYAYDALDRLEQLADGTGAMIVSYGYDSTGRLGRKDMGNDTYTTYEYDSSGQLLHLVNRAPDDSVNSRFDYTYDSLGNRTSMDTLDGNCPFS